MSGKDALQSASPSEGIGARAPWASRVMGRGENLGRHLLSRLRPRISLASGSVLVLLTFLLPIGYESCGPETKGYELIQGRGDWPTFAGILLSEYFGPFFYGVVLLLAVWTALLTIISLSTRQLFQNRLLMRGMFVASGTLSLFLITDVFTLLPIGAETYGAIAGALIFISCVLPGIFWPMRIFLRWFVVLLVSAMLLGGLAGLGLIQGDTPAWFLFWIWGVYGLVPVALWWVGLSGKFGTNWIGVRRGLIALYTPGALGDLWFFFVAWREGIWGFVPCCLGLHLMTLGYMRLARDEQKAAQSMMGGR